jgi:hypothetical protein
MSGQTPPNGRRSHITKKVRLASMEHVCQQTQSEKVGIMAAFTGHLAAWVKINLGDTTGHVVANPTKL